MRTILVPTDYSKTANGAVKYAAGLAKSTGAKLVLLHAFHIPVQVSEVPFSAVSEQELEESSMKGLKKVEQKLHSKIKGLKTECVVRYGFAPDVINEVAKEKNADIVVMGIAGTGAISEALLGSVAVDTVRDAVVPVIVVPRKVKFTKPEKIIFAYDYSDIKDTNSIAELCEVVTLFDSRLMIANVITQDEKATFSKAIAGIKMEGMLQRVPHTLHFPVNDSVTDGINEFVRDTSAGMVAMIAHRHNMFYRLFNQSSTKRMAFHTEVPLLFIPERTAVE